MKVVLGCEIVEKKDGTTRGNAYDEDIENYSSEELFPFFKEKNDEKTKVKAYK